MGCKKDSNDPAPVVQNNTVTVDASGNLIFPATIQGAFYTIKGKQEVYESSSLINEVFFYSYMGWGGSTSNFVDLDSVKATNSAGTHILEKQSSFYNWYTHSEISIGDSTLYDNIVGPISWNVKGSSAFPAINYVDNTGFPTLSFTSSGINSLTNSISFNINSNSDYQVVEAHFYNIDGDEKTIRKTISGSSGTITFNSNEWKTDVPGSLSSVAFLINTYEFGNVKTINSKNLYFVKQISKNFAYTF